MSLENNLLNSFKELYEKQDILSKLTDKKLYTEHGYSEIHCIEAIGIIKDANVTKLSDHLKITKSAISKITKRLIKKEIIVTFKKENNKKEVYFHLTSIGEQLYKQHEKAHLAWIQRDSLFLSSLETKDKEMTLQVIKNFNSYLENIIQEESSC